MSITLLKLVFECEDNLTPPEDHVLLYIANKVNEGEGNVAWCTQDYLSKKSRLSIATVKRACNSLREKGIISWVQKHRDKGKFKRNHYTINHSSLRAIVKEKEVSQRTNPKGQRDTQVSITVSDNNLTNNLETITILYEENKNELFPKERTSAHCWTKKYMNEDKFMEYDYIYKYLVVWLKLGHTQKLWDDFNNGLISPIEKGWT